MRIDRIRFQNFRCFEDREFELASRFNLVIGDNGKGKTSLVNGLSIALNSILEFPPARSFDLNFNVARLATFWNNGKPNVEPQFPARLECHAHIDQRTAYWAWEFHKPGRTGWSVTGGAPVIFEEMASRVASNTPVVLPVIAYYGTGRLWKQKKRGKIKTTSPGSRLLGYLDWVDPASDEKRLLEWFKTRELVALQKKKTLDDLEAVRKAIYTCVFEANEIFWDIETDQLAIRFDKKIDKNIDRQITWFNNLSDGYRNMLAMVADIAQRCVTLNPQLGADAIQQTPGIVLIDEIDLHLHPKWQQRVVEDLLRAFPQVQFVATTHSLFIIQSLVPKKGIKLINLDKPEANDFTNKSVEDITEEIQGVDDPPPQRSKRHQDMMKAAEEYYRVLNQIPKAPEKQVEVLRKKLDDLMVPFSDDPAYQSFLRMQRAAVSVEGDNGHAPD